MIMVALFQISVKVFPLVMITTTLLSLRSFVIAQEDSPKLGYSVKERDSLYALKSSLDNPFLNSVWNGSDHCHTNTSKWYGIRCNSDGFVMEIVLESVGLKGNIDPDAFSSFAELSVLSLKNNSLGGTGIYFAFNRKLTRVDLSGNNFSGRIPVSLLGAPDLASVLLSNNALTGPIPGFDQPSLREFDVSDNNLEGPIPKTRALKSFSYSSFSGNPRLCGPPSPTACEPVVITESSSSSSNESSSEYDNNNNNNQKTEKKSFTESINWYLLLFELVVLVVLFLLFVLYLKKASELKKKMAREHSSSGGRNQLEILAKEEEEQTSKNIEEEQEQRSNTGILGQRDQERSGNSNDKLTFLDRGDCVFEISDLLKGSAEWLGKGKFGNSYKVVMEGKPVVVVVKRLRNLKPMTGEEFERQLLLVAGLKHPNLLPLLAYNNDANGERWLLHKYVERGNLYDRLHGGRSKEKGSKVGRVRFRWQSRLNVARGVARAMSHLHQNTTLLVPHGNLKSTNVLVGPTAPLVSDYGLAPLLALPASAAFHSPECRSSAGTGRASRKSNVWSYGCLVLELLTGRAAAGPELASWAQRAVREEWTAEVFDGEILSGAGRAVVVPAMLRLLEIALMCVERSPERRPEMSDVARMVEAVRLADVSEDDMAADHDVSSSASFDRSLTDDSMSFDRGRGFRVRTT